jgi:hypothetical protein
MSTRAETSDNVGGDPSANRDVGHSSIDDALQHSGMAHEDGAEGTRRHFLA